MAHRCFISFKKEDVFYKDELVKILKGVDIPVNVLDKVIDSEDIDYVLQKIRDDYMNNTTVTLFLIGEHSSEKEGVDENGFNHQSYIIRELRATLMDREGNPRDGLLGIVLPNMYDAVYGQSYQCEHCHQTIKIVNIGPSTTIKEFSENYYLHKGKCGHYSEENRFCVLAKYDDFIKNPKHYIDLAYDKINQPIAKEVHYKDITHQGKI